MMNSSLRTTLVAIVSLVAGALITAGILSTRQTSPPTAGDAAGSAASQRTPRYHCPMHPSIVSDKPGQCPICQMSLVLNDSQGDEARLSAESKSPPVEGRSRVSIATDRVQLIGVKTALVERRPLTRTIRAVGRVTADETRLHHVHTKVGGWIERVHASSTGELVREGQPLLSIYSPELLASQEEYLLALKARQRLSESSRPDIVASGEELVASARRRLRLLDISDEQIDSLERSGVASRTTTLSAPMSGHIMVRNVQHGERIEPGTTVLDIADLSHVWVIADIYEYELPFVHQGQKATMTLPYLPGREFSGRVSVIYPFLSESTRTVKARLEFNNAALTLKPEMYAEVAIQSALGEKIVVPDSAIVSTGRRDIVFVAIADGVFDPREVRLGARIADGAEILEGLVEGERVVVSGNFMIDSESRLRAAREAAVPGHSH